MSDYTTSKPIEMFGKERSFRALSGVVINAAQRSDTYVRGSGSSSSFNGYGGGQTSIGSTVVVTSDIWIRGVSGKEYRLRFTTDIPVRDGNVIHAIDVVNANVEVTEGFYDGKLGKIVSTTSVRDVPVSDGYVLLYNSSTEEWFYTGGLNTTVRNVSPWGSFWKIIGVCSLLGGVAGLINGHVFAGTFLGALGGGFISAFWIGHLVVGDALTSDHKKLGRIFESTFSSELDEIAKQLMAPASVVPTIKNSNQESTGRFCTQCGKSAEEGIRFCSSCGTQLAVNPTR